MKKTILISLITLLVCKVYGQINDITGITTNIDTNIKTKIATLKKEDNLKNSKSAIIINVLPSPSPAVCDIAYDGQNLWVGGYNEYLIYKISPIDGSIIKSIPTNVQYALGLTFDGLHLWLTDQNSGIIYQIDTLDGNIIQSFNTPANYGAGLAWDGNKLWLNDYGAPDTLTNNDTTYTINTAGQITNRFDAYGSPVGLAFDGSYLWSTDNNQDVIHQIDPSSFTILQTLNAPGGDYPNGLTFDGQYLWLANNDSDSIYQIDIDFVNGLNESTVASNQFTVYPNPSNGRFYFKPLDSGKFNSSITIYNQAGQIVLDKSITDNSSFTIDLNEFNSTLFFYTIETSNGTSKTGKLIKR